MSIQYEALIGYLSVVGGQANDEAPPGAKIQVPPRRAHRSREHDTFFILVTPAGQVGAKPDFYEGLAALACNVFFKSRLGVTGALREVANALNEDIIQRNQQQGTEYRAGALVMVKREEEVYLMRAGTAICVAQRHKHYETFPLDPDMLNLMPLGARSEPQLEFTRYPLAPNDIFILGDGNIAAISDAILRAAVATQNISMVLETLERSVQRQAFAMVIQFIDANAPTPEANTADVPHETGIAITDPQAIEQVETLSTQTVDETNTTESSSEPLAESPTPLTPSEEDITTTDTSSLQEEETFKPEDAEQILAPRRRQNILQILFAGFLLVIAGILRALANGLNAILDRLLPEPTHKEKNQQFVPMNIVALVAIIVPAIVAVIVVGVAISNRDETAFEGLREITIQARLDALQLEDNPQASKRDKRFAWLEVRRWAQQALNENPKSEEVIDILLEAQNKINFYDRVVPTQVTELREFEPNADLRGPIVGGQDIYTLDRNRSQVYRDVLDGAGRTIIEKGEIPVLERGRRVNNFIVSNIIDIEWITTPGAAQTRALIALDDNGLLLSYHPTFGEGAIQLELPPEWSRPVAIALWDVNLYVLDAGANQIWRYRPENGFFQNPPEEYFTGNSRPELRAAVDFGIEQGGDVFILFNDGTIARYRGGEPIPFELNEELAPVEGITNGTALYVNNDDGDYALYVADQNNATVYKISLGGSVRGGYRPLDLLSDIFNEVTGVYDDPARGNIYILSGNKLYHAPRITE